MAKGKKEKKEQTSTGQSEDIKEGWTSRNANIMEFKKPGDSIEGELVAIEEGHTYKNKVYKIQTEKNGLFAVFGTAVLEQKMNGVELGTLVRIRLVGTQPPKKEGQNPLKLFDVFTK